MCRFSNADRFARLRGVLTEKPPGARGLEHIGRNPDCLRLLVITLASISPAAIMTEVYHDTDLSEGQSPLALIQGIAFEQQLFAADAALIRSLYQDAGYSTADTWTVVNIPALAGGTGDDARARRETLTLQFLQQRLADESPTPCLLLHPRLIITIIGIPFAIEPDALVAMPDAHFFKTIEIKSYADRGGKTDEADLRSACRQGSVGVVALRQAYVRLGVTSADTETMVPAVADLILRRVGSMRPTLRNMTVAGEVSSLCRTIARIEAYWQKAEALIGPDRALDDLDAFFALPHHYTEQCREYCALAPQCKREAILHGEPALLGDAARDILAPAGTLSRALELRDGRGEPPRNAAEAALQVWLCEGFRVYREAVGPDV